MPATASTASPTARPVRIAMSRRPRIAARTRCPTFHRAASAAASMRSSSRRKSPASRLLTAAESHRLVDVPPEVESAEFTTMRRLTMRFRGLLCGGTVERLDIEDVRNAVLELWSNGQTEGQINKLKTLERACMPAPALTCCVLG